MRINLVPMAGEGKRYKDVGFTIPKPFIDVGGMPMVVRACKALPAADKNIFVCRKHHMEEYPIQDILEKYLNNVIIVTIDELTEGQAITCLAARNHIPDNAILNIGASDNDMVYNENVIEEMYRNPELDGWIWTFRNNPAVLQNPKMYGWVEIKPQSTKATHVSCKKPISNNPMSDHAIVGAFTFKKAKSFFDSIDYMVKSNYRLNNEFYVDVAADFAIKSGLNIHIYEVNQYICWGTPQDYQEYQYWLTYFKKGFNLVTLSIVIPCYNESKSLPRLFQTCLEACKGRNDIQFIFVNNGSNDDTQIVLNQLLNLEVYNFGKSVHVPFNKGYGFGILQGLLLAEGRVLSWTHADLQTDPKDVILAFELYKVELESNHCIVKGERKGRNLFDNIFTGGMSLMSSLLLNQKLWDINAQPKIFHRDFMGHLKKAPHDFSLDLYVLFVANRINVSIKSFPVFFSNREFGEAKGGGTLKGKFKLIKRTIRYIIELRNDIIKGNR